MSAGVTVRSFVGAGGTREVHLAVEASGGLSLAGQIADVETRYRDTLCRLGLSPNTAVFRRVFLSDILNQAPVLQRSTLLDDPLAGPVAVSVIQQPPLSGAKVALLAYHVDGAEPLVKHALSLSQMRVDRGGLGHLWSTRLCAGLTSPGAGAADQTELVFDRLVAALAENGGTLLDHCVRTWLFLKDVDLFYLDMVNRRTELFARHGLTADTHYISSTGIEGACTHQFDVVAMDAYSVLGMQPGQMTFLNDFERLCPTHDYQVTFERGTRIAYADRAHHFISGTASIDRFGQVLHLGDVVAQLDRSLENVAALLASGQGQLGDLMHLIVYLRDISDAQRVRTRLADVLPDLPIIVVQGAVCRPDWLIEIEGIAVSADHRPDMPGY
jgi:enamine deaminase RidA (YjgF/YER057c/UK114 family)